MRPSGLKSTIKIAKSVMNMDGEITLGTTKMLDARRQEATTEAYEKYAAGRSERSQHSR
jgi:hypothetical protein